MKILLPLALVVAVLLVYAVWGREWLKKKSWAQGFFSWVEPIEIFLYKKSETILFARLKIVSGLLLTFLTSIGNIDLTPITPFVPEKYQWLVSAAVNLLPLLISFVGWMDESLRKGTTLPIEIVETPDKVIAENPKVAEAVAMAQATKVEAVAVVKEEAAVEAAKAA